MTINSSCTRCRAPVQFTGRPPGENARLLRRSATPVGYCAACALANWIQNDPLSDSIRYVIERKGGPVCLLDRQVIDQMTNVLAAGFADANPQEIDWVSVVINWDLPFTKAARQ